MSITAKILAFYLGIGPVYWLPGVPFTFLIYIKTTCLLLIYLISIAKGFSGDSFEFPCGKKLFCFFVVYFILLTPGFVFGKIEAGFYQIQNALQIILFVYSCNLIFKNNSIVKITKIASLIFLLLSGLSLVFIIFIPDVTNQFNAELTVADSGFGGLRTGWSPANAMFVPWVLTSGVLFVSSLGIFGGTTVLIANQILVGGRAGLLASISVLFLFFIFKKKKIIIFGILLLIFVGWNGLIQYTDILRLSSIKGGSGAEFENIDDLSSGRVGQYFWVLDIIFNNPLTGIGFGNLIYGGSQRLNVHNDFLKMAGEGGLLYAISAFLIVFFGLYQGYLKSKAGSSISRAAFLTLTAGLVVAQFEPGFLFSNFNTSCFWWFCFAICVSSVYRRRTNKLICRGSDN